MAGELGGASSHSPDGRSGAKPSSPGGAADEFAQRLREATDNLGEIQLADLAETGQHHVKPRLEQVESAPPRQPTTPGSAFRPKEASPPSSTASAYEDQSSLRLDGSGGGASMELGHGVGLELDHRPLRGAMGRSEDETDTPANPTPSSVTEATTAGESTALVSRAEGGLPATRPPASMAGFVPLASPAPVQESVSLFGTDRLTGVLIGLAIGLAVGLGPAWAWSQSLLERTSRPLIVEMEDVIDRPLMVRAGKLRAPNDIATEIQGLFGAARSRFWWTWLGFGAVFALGLGLPTRRPRA